MLKENVRIVSAVDSPVLDKCCHHWVIQGANGPFSQGECQKCHEVRHFQNFIEMSDWGDVKQPEHPEQPEIADLPDPEDVEYLGFYLEDFNPAVDLTAEENAATG